MPTTPNLQLQRPLNGTFVGTWDTPVNSNWDALDNALGAVATVALTNVPVVLSAAQYACAFINFTGALTGNCVITFPAYGRFWIVQNNCTNIGTFSVICKVNPAANFIALPPGEAMTVMSDGTNMNFVGLGHVGTYWDFGGSTVPLWVTASSPAPYLNCDGSAFSAVTYPALAAFLGGATLPDARGRFRAALNQTTGRLTGGVDGNTLLAAGGSQTILKANLPSYALTVTDPGHFHGYFAAAQSGQFQEGSGSFANYYVRNSQNTQAATTGISVASGGSGTGYAPPAYIGGLTLIRAG